MNRWISTLFLVSTACAHAPAADSDETAGGATSAAVQTYDAETFFETTAYLGLSFSPDETRVLVSSDKTGVFNAYAITIADEKQTALTQSVADAVFAYTYFPNDDRIIYGADQGGNELTHIYVLEAGGTARDLTPGDKLKARFSGFTKDGSAFFVSTNERDPKAFDLYRYDAATLERTMVFQNDGSFLPGPHSPDGKHLALTKVKNNADSDIYLASLDDPKKAPVHITKHEGNANHEPQTFDVDSKLLYYTTDADGEFYTAWTYDLASGAKTKVIEAKWDVRWVSFSDSGRFRLWAINADASTELHVLDTTSNQEVKLPPLPDGVITGVEVSKSDKRLAFYVNGDRSPSNLFVVDLEEMQPKQLTQALSDKIDPAHLVEAEVIRYKSYDGIEIPALLYRPHGSSAKKPAPAMLWIHGGPGGQSRRGYRAAIQHLVNHGYAILAVNNRGSSGYGKTFHHLDDRKHGEADLDDCVEARRYLESLDWIDKKRIGIMGGSYGGYMVVAALAFRPKVFDVGIDVFGVTNWVRTLESIPPWWAAFREYLYAELGDPATDKERLKRISPLFSADKIERPLLVVQGANDPRVIKVESDEIVEAVKKNGVPVEYVVFDDEGHGFRKKLNRITAQEAYLTFLKKHL